MATFYLPIHACGSSIVCWGHRGRAETRALAETMENLVGPQNRCAVDLHDFATTFGLESTLGKKLILVSEAGVDVRSSSAIVEKIKKFTGNDLISINRKNKTSLSVRLGTKIVVVSNHLIQLADGSGALFDRLIPLQFLRSIPKDDRDKDFPVKQLAELPGIVLLALRGWKRLNENRQFTLPNSSKTVLNEMRETGSPVLMFIEEMCRLEKDGFTPTDTLWNGWKHFCGEHDIAVSEQSEIHLRPTVGCPSIAAGSETERQEESDSRIYRHTNGCELAPATF